MSYHNPVYNHSCPDPFVLKYCGEYWSYSTGIQPDGGWFGVARSRNLVDWERVGSAMEPLPGTATCLWAPEVTYDNGRFYMFYSYGDEVNMEIRVSIAEHPAGPFIDSGRRLTDEQFAIDAHVFTDDDGTRFLFYATDYLDYSHIGTGTARRRMRDLLTLEGPSFPVTRAQYDWQVYDPHRAAKGGVRWHTIEGSFVLKRKGRYYQMFSGGNWQNMSYGVSYATTTRIDAPGEWQQHADGTQILPILRTIPGQVIGPGHNSVVRGPDNRQLFCVYHRWNNKTHERVMAIDPLDWAGERMLVLGPSTAPQPRPNDATIVDWFDQTQDDSLGALWTCAGDQWSVRDHAAQQHAERGLALARCAAPPCFVAEVSVRATAHSDDGRYGVSLGDDIAWLIEPATGRLVTRSDGEHITPLPQSFEPRAYHLLRVERNGQRATLTLDGIVHSRVLLPAGAADSLALRTEHCAAAFAGFTLTEGWEDVFTETETPAALGWNTNGDDWRVAEGQLQCAGDGRAFKGPLPAAYGLVVNVRALAADAAWTICLAADASDHGTTVALQRANAGWALRCSVAQGAEDFPLPVTFDPLQFQQFRFTFQQNRLAIYWETTPVCEIAAPDGASGVALAGRGAAFDMVRVTALR